MKTKTVTLLAIAGGIAYLGYRTKQQAEALAAAAAAVQPPPPNGGPVVNGLSFYQLEGLAGFSLKKAVKSVTNTVQKVTDNKILRPVLAVASGGASELTRVTANVVADPAKELKRINPIKMIKPKGQAQDTTPVTAETQYADINGASITRAQYDAIMAAIQTGVPIATTGGWALPAGYISAVNPNPALVSDPTTPAASNWRNKGPATARPQRPRRNTGVVPPSINQGTAPVNYTPQPNEELIVNSSTDSDYGLPGTEYTADPSGAPALPGGITSALNTPAAQEAAPETAAPPTNTGAAIIGTALAAGAAYLAFS